DDKGWDARKRAYCLKIQPATGSFARNLIYSTKPVNTKKTNREGDFPAAFLWQAGFLSAVCARTATTAMNRDVV
ncbi:MAG: hypothetical protein E6304_16935, partial [Enterobacter roggenkampii]|nr:hypothetical protein [Enterobacter roggenkampii]